MKKNGFLGIRMDESNLDFVKKEAKKQNQTMSDWIRKEITIIKENKK
jgi:hypothetical protein